MESNVYQTLVNSLKANPRNILSKRNLWSYYRVEYGKIVVSKGTMQTSNSSISTPRPLNPSEAETVFQMWKAGRKREEIRDFTQNASYWIALFEDVFGGK